jgi:hypothetical protein
MMGYKDTAPTALKMRRKERWTETGWLNKVACVKRDELHCKFNIVSLVSLVLAIFTLFLWLATFWVNPWDHRVSLTNNFHVSVWNGFSGDTLGRLIIFNNAQYGPYRGSIMLLTDSNQPPPIVRGWSIGHYSIGQETDFDRRGEVLLIEKACDMPGIYFRHFRRPNEALPLWTLMVSLWYPLFLFNVLPAVWIFRRWRSRRSQPSRA